MRYFEIPTQVKFYDYDAGGYVRGIAYRDEVICGCCGGIFKVEELYEFAPSDVTPIIAYDWADITYEICGD